MVSEDPYLRGQFQERYKIANDPAMRRVDRAVIGADYGSCSYTTSEQADQLVELLRVNEDMLLLDVGSGAGWPGIYLAEKTGCSVALLDPTEEGMVIAAERSATDGVAAAAIVALGNALPFGEEVFDAATSSDVFC